MTAREAKQKLKSLATPDVAMSSGRFFKTGPGQYGEGDIFIGVKVPTLRSVSREFRSLPLAEVGLLLSSPIHEERHLALMILVLYLPLEPGTVSRLFSRRHDSSIGSCS